MRKSVPEYAFLSANGTRMHRQHRWLSTTGLMSQYVICSGEWLSGYEQIAAAHGFQLVQGGPRWSAGFVWLPPTQNINGFEAVRKGRLNEPRVLGHVFPMLLATHATRRAAVTSFHFQLDGMGPPPVEKIVNVGKLLWEKGCLS